MRTTTILGVLLAAATAIATSAPAQADFTASGTFLYRDRPFTYNSGFTGGTPTLPVRFAQYQVRDANSGVVIASGNTDANGDFSILVPGSGTRDIIVRCISNSKVYGANRRIRVRTTGGTLYNVESATFVGWNQNTNLDIGTVIAEKIFTGSFQANPFNMLDLGVHALDYILAQGESNPTGHVNIHWPGGSGSFASGFTANMSDDDGYDDMVILHELGHVFHNMYSDSDSPGGFHTFGDSDQDPRLSYGEGWATFFAGAVRNYMGVFDPAFYMDANGTASGSIQLRARLENASPYTSSTSGEANEVGVACMLWDIVDTASTNDGNATDDEFFDGSTTFGGGLTGDQMQWVTFSGPVQSASNLTINDHWTAFFTPTNHGSYIGLRDVFDAFGVRNYLDAEEPNNNTGSATPNAGDNTWSAIKTLYYSPSFPPAPANNDSDYYSITLAVGDELEVETRYPGGGAANTYADTFLTLRRPNGSTFASSDTGGAGRNAKLDGIVADTAGTWTVEVETLSSIRETGSYELRIDRSGFSVNNVTPSSVAAVSNPAQVVVLSGIGFDDITSMTLDGITLTPFLFGNGNYQIVSDSELHLIQLPLLGTIGVKDLVLNRSSGGPLTEQLTIIEPPTPVMVTSTPLTSEFLGINLTIGSRVGDFAVLCLSYFNSPTDYSPYTMLDIGLNDTDVSIIIAPFIGPGAYEQLISGQITGFGLSGSTLYWQTFVMEVSNGFNPPWPASNVVSTQIF